ncbi:MAG TPA: hypothetical protein ENG37_01960 [Firmicutes bacterium]|nr:hypothetical protein [Bacillota bacterium]
MNPKERRYYKDKIQYYVFKATPLESYTNPLMIKGKPLFLHLPQQSFKIAVSEEMYKHTEEFSMLGKTFDVRITFRRINPKVIIIDEFQVTEIKINNNLDSEVTQ